MLAIAAVCLAPFVAAWIAYFYWQPQGGANYGELIPAHALRGVVQGKLQGHGVSANSRLKSLS